MTMDLSAAFDAVAPEIPLHRLGKWVGLAGTVLNWFESYLEKRHCFISMGNSESEPTKVTCGVPRGSILGPLPFNIYMLPLAQIMDHSNISYQTYADDTQLYVSVSWHYYSPSLTLSQRIHQMNERMCRNFLRLDADEREGVAFGHKDERSMVGAQFDSL